MRRRRGATPPDLRGYDWVVHGDRFWREGFVGPVRVVTATEAAAHRRAMERAEARLGPLHYRDKVHTVLRSAYELAIHPTLLDVVEQCIGSDILLYNATYIVKEPGSASHVSWHQDLTYWGLDDPDAQVSAWLALASATEQSGCMSMVPGSHLGGCWGPETPGGFPSFLLGGGVLEV